jgi:hypothetical protein
MVLRFAAPLLLLAACAAVFSQTSSQPDPNTPKYFHDSTLGVSYFYPGRFTPEAAGPAKNEGVAKCAQPTLAGSSVSPVGVSAFVFSTIGNACPGVLHSAAMKLDEFTREQVLNQLKQYGKPVVTQDPTSYTIDGHPAVVTIASVQQSTRIDLNNIAHPKMIYAAKACVLGNIPPRRSKSNVADETKQIFCFDYTTHEHDLLPVMLAFTMQFDGQEPQPMVPGGILR